MKLASANEGVVVSAIHPDFSYSQSQLKSPPPSDVLSRFPIKKTSSISHTTLVFATICSISNQPNPVSINPPLVFIKEKSGRKKGDGCCQSSLSSSLPSLAPLSRGFRKSAALATSGRADTWPRPGNEVRLKLDQDWITPARDPKQAIY